jgi:hypothetical protein
MKKFVVVLLVLALLVGAGLWYFVSFRLDSMIETRIEQAGSQSFGTRVSVGAVKTSIRDGSLEISEITVANPPGYRNATAFSLNNIEAAVDYGSRDIKRLVIDRPDIVIEELGGKTNFEQMLAELEGMETAPGDTGAAEPEIVIRHFRMNESRAAFESASLDRYTDVEVDAIELNDIRGTPTEVARIIAREVVSEITSEAATEMLQAQARRKLDEVDRKVGEKLQEILGGDDPDDAAGRSDDSGADDGG